MIAWFDASQIEIAGHALPTQGPLAIVGIGVGHVTYARWLQRYHGVTALRADQMGFAILASAVIVGHVVGVWTLDPEAPLYQLAAPQSSLGALLGGGLVGLTVAKLLNLSIAVVVDAAAWAFLHGWPFVRLGCALAHDHPGRHSTLPIAVAYPTGPRLDIGLLEWLYCLALLAFAYALMRRMLVPGRLAAWATLLFAGGRLVLELLRVDHAEQLVQGPNMFALVLCLGGLVIGAVLWRISRPRPGDPR